VIGFRIFDILMEFIGWGTKKKRKMAFSVGFLILKVRSLIARKQSRPAAVRSLVSSFFLFYRKSI